MEGKVKSPFSTRGKRSSTWTWRWTMGETLGVNIDKDRDKDMGTGMRGTRVCLFVPVGGRESAQRLKEGTKEMWSRGKEQGRGTGKEHCQEGKEPMRHVDLTLKETPSHCPRQVEHTRDVDDWMTWIGLHKTTLNNRHGGEQLGQDRQAHKEHERLSLLPANGSADLPLPISSPTTQSTHYTVTTPPTHQHFTN
ncbi:hypothetical protein BU24DRAFT_480663 [Aaosphaeria arxii CBS 175.79]|uniref:Uncharacterized protein n=1 Tax=Aaosphaeria arxii CBS 175.79 TaxID=1450172 RepID=A0A6A5XSQ6_9PLEO|nr:uncharacterized protein BU24DRAFT_480663 [Aaosphaeria arxii CBS 175.79]KAF2015946.1 hypothetical protein BU24DRAFT_480663 [Aaosphaeria arxii CBS 175.79]